MRLKVMKDIFTKQNYINMDPAWGTLFEEFIVENEDVSPVIFSFY